VQRSKTSGARVRLGSYEFKKKGVSRFDLRAPYHLAVALTWPQFLAALLALRQVGRARVPVDDSGRADGVRSIRTRVPRGRGWRVGFPPAGALSGQRLAVGAQPSRPGLATPYPGHDLTDEEAAALTRELHDIVENDRYAFSPRVQTLRAILGKLRPEPVRETLRRGRCMRRREQRWPGDDGAVRPREFRATARVAGREKQWKSWPCGSFSQSSGRS
jgi:hypothetical protein